MARQHGHDTWVPPSRRVPGRLPSGSCTVDAYGSEAGDAWGRGAGTTRAAERVLTGSPSLCRQHNDCAVPPRAWFHHHARQQRPLWPIRPVGPSAFTVTTTPLCCTPLCLGSTAHDDEPDHSSKMETGSLVKDGNRITRQTGPAARSRASSSGSDHRCRDHWRCQGCRGRRC